MFRHCFETNELLNNILPHFVTGKLRQLNCPHCLQANEINPSNEWDQPRMSSSDRQHEVSTWHPYKIAHVSGHCIVETNADTSWIQQPLKKSYWTGPEQCCLLMTIHSFSHVFQWFILYSSSYFGPRWQIWTQFWSWCRFCQPRKSLGSTCQLQSICFGCSLQLLLSIV